MANFVLSKMLNLAIFLKKITVQPISNIFIVIKAESWNKIILLIPNNIFLYGNANMQPFFKFRRPAENIESFN